MAGDDKVQFRCTTKTRARFERMLADIHPLGDREEQIKRLLEVYETNPDRFRREYR